MRMITNEILKGYRYHLINEEKSAATIEKYIRDVKMFSIWLDDKKFDKADVLKYKADLMEKYAPASVNSALSSLNGFFNYIGWYELRVKTLKIQKQIFASDEKELTKSEYERLLKAAKSKNNERLYLLMLTICSTGIRVSELRYITVEAISRGFAEIRCKGKQRTVFLPKSLCKLLKKYVKAQKIKSGAIFITKNYKPLDRSNIWSDMKKLCRSARVPEKKVFPHNLRHLFARTYYTMQKDIVRLADILGHSSVNTTRIYTMESGRIHRRQIEKLGLLKC
ncbi:MAG: tyrosine-type recombinase/integrase [Clostridia bacterium]|nr:tyrosine-type recombinase/integrase [Clostridia bacterium]